MQVRTSFGRSALRAAMASGWIGLTAALVAASGCDSPRDGFACQTNDQCVLDDGSQGVCEDTGACSFADEGCTESGRRYGEASPEALRSRCVVAAVGGRCIQQLSAGGHHTCAIKVDGTLWCWGGNDKGQLGDGSFTARAAAAKISGVDGVRFIRVSAGIEHTCAIDEAGAVYCWGSNGEGQLGVLDGQGKQLGDSSVPVQVAGLGGAATAISAGGKHTCTIVGGALYCWGENASNQLGDGSVEERITPVLVPGIVEVAAVSNGDEHTCALDQNGVLWCWGTNTNGQLGIAAITSAATPTKVTSLTSVTDLAVGDEHTCINKPDTTIWCWGYNATGEVGNGGSTDQMAPVKIGSSDHVISSGSAFHSCSWTTDGALSCWGSNDKGQIGDGSTGLSVSTPSLVKLITVTTVVTGGGHTCALTRDGLLWCWGDNALGQLGPKTSVGESAVPRIVPICP